MPGTALGGLADRLAAATLAFEPRDLVLLMGAARMLAEARTLDDIRKVANLAQRAQDYAKAARLGLDAQNSAAAIRLEAEAKAGELLIEMKDSGERRVKGESLPHVEAGDMSPSTLDDLGVTRDESFRWQAVARIPAEERAAYVAGAQQDELEVTRAGLLRFAQGAHTSSNSGNEWYTPPRIIAAARTTMGGIDLDPASTEEANEVVNAATIYTAQQDGVAQEWFGRVWLNPPYSYPDILRFIRKLMAEREAGQVEQTCVLVNNATETEWFQGLSAACSAICFPNGRIRFWHPHKQSTTPLQGQAIVYFGERPQAFVEAHAEFGVVVRVVGPSRARRAA